MDATMAREPSPVVRSVRDRIDEIADRNRRRAILRALGCFEPHGDSIRRTNAPKTAIGAEMPAAIDALDCACLRGSEEEIEATGARLIDLWAQCLTIRIAKPRVESD
jgi:hypothetical protein